MSLSRLLAPRRQALKILNSFVFHRLIVSAKVYNDCSFVEFSGDRFHSSWFGWP